MIIERQRKAGARKEALAATKEREATDRPWRMHIRTEKPKQRRYTTNGAKSQESEGRQYKQQAAQQRSKQQGKQQYTQHAAGTHTSEH
mgnify:CR=1 FL=1